MLRDQPNQVARYYAYDRTTNEPALGIEASITASQSKEGLRRVVLEGTIIEEDRILVPGYYICPLERGESNAYHIHFGAVSSLPNILVIAVPDTIYTQLADFSGPSEGVLAEEKKTNVLLQTLVDLQSPGG